MLYQLFLQSQVPVAAGKVAEIGGKMTAKNKTSFVRDVLAFGAKNGYKAYAVNGHDTFGYLVTPNDNVLVVNKGDFGGVTFTFAYVPSKETGTGCSCCDDAQYKVNLNILERLERDGLDFAKKIGAPRYANSKHWLNTCYWKNELQEVPA